MKMRVAYAKRRYKEDKVYITPLVVTSYRDEDGTPRNKTIVSLNKLPHYIVKLVEEGLKRGDTGVLDEYVHVKDYKHLRSVVVGPAFVVLSVLKGLGIFSAVKSRLTVKQAAAVLAIIVERVISAKPLSVMALQRTFAHEGLSVLLGMEKSPVLNTWYRALGKLESSREEILLELFERNHKPGQLYLYDITSSYFEGETCELAAFGYNRDGKKGKKQVVIGVICDEEGCPIWVDVFKGDTSDQTTVRQQLLNLREKLGLEEFIFVGDRGMVTSARIEELEREGWWESFSYITALTRQEMMSLVEDVNHPMQLELFEHRKLREVEHEGTRYVLCHNPHRMERDRECRQRLLELTEAKLESIKNNVEAGRWKREAVIAQRLYRWLHQWKMQRFFEVHYGEGRFSYRRREEEIQRYARLDGCYVIRSNAAKWKQTTEELRDRYKDLKYIEQAFRTMKSTDIQTRPIRHFHEQQVRGHIFACFLAYRVVWELRGRLEPVLRRDPESKRCEAGSLAEVWRSLSVVSLAKVEAGGKVYLKLSEISSYVNKLLALCKVPSLEELFSE